MTDKYRLGDGGRRERVLARAAVADGGYVAATARALYPPASHHLDRVTWDLVGQVSWAAPDLVVEVVPVDGTRPTLLRLTLADPGALPEVVRERVTASIVAETHVAFRGERGARFAARRTEDGAVRWTVALDAGLDPHDPAVRAAADAALAGLRSAWGV